MVLFALGCFRDIILIILGKIISLFILFSEALIIGTLFVTLLPTMSDGIGKMALIIGLPLAVLIGDVFLLGIIFKSGKSF